MSNLAAGLICSVATRIADTSMATIIITMIITTVASTIVPLKSFSTFRAPTALLYDENVYFNYYWSTIVYWTC